MLIAFQSNAQALYRAASVRVGQAASYNAHDAPQS